MAACSGNFAYQSGDDTTLITDDQTVIKCKCGKVNVELCNGKPLGAALCVCKDCWACRKYCAKQQYYEGDDQKTESPYKPKSCGTVTALETQHYVYFSNELKILKGDDNVRFAVMKKFKAKNDFIRMYAKCCHTIMLGYSKKFQGFDEKRVAYLVSDEGLYKGKTALMKPACIMWKNDMVTKKFKALAKVLKLENVKLQLNVGQVNPKGDRKAAADMGRFRVTIGTKTDPEPGKKGLSFLKLMEAQLKADQETEPDVFDTSGK